MKKGLIISAILTITVMLVSCSKSEHGEMKKFPPVKTVIKTAKAENTAQYVQAPGQITSNTDAYLSAKSAGTILSIHVKSGDKVKKGQSLLSIDASDIKSKLQQAKGGLAQAKAALSIAEANYKRFQELYKKNACSKVELEQMEYQYNAAKGAVETAKGGIAEANSYLKYANVKAPFDAIVVERMVNIGDFVGPGRPLFRLIDPKKMRFDCTVSESDAHFIKVGDTVSIKLDTLNKEIEGTVAEISAGSDFMTHSVLVRVELPKDIDGLKAGMYGVATFKGDTVKKVIIPSNWIVKRGELQMVFLKGKDGKAKMQIIRTGKKLGDKVEVISGLNGGEKIATTSLNKIFDGVKLEAK